MASEFYQRPTWECKFQATRHLSPKTALAWSEQMQHKQQRQQQPQSLYKLPRGSARIWSPKRLNYNLFPDDASHYPIHICYCMCQMDAWWQIEDGLAKNLGEIQQMTNEALNNLTTRTNAADVKSREEERNLRWIRVFFSVREVCFFRVSPARI